MEITSILKGDSLKRLLQGLALGAALTMIVGFSWGGWMLGSSSREMAQSTANAAVVKALVPICVAQFQQGSGSTAKLAELKKASSWDQSVYIEKGGWSAMPGSTTNVSGVAQACATALRDMS
jgi:hypothetical protein